MEKFLVSEEKKFYRIGYRIGYNNPSVIAFTPFPSSI